MNGNLGGMYAALMTGFDDSGEFCPTRQKNIVDYVGRQGLQGMYIGGSSGESGLMSTDELLAQQEVIASIRNDAHGTIIAHVGQPSTRDSIKLAENAKRLGFEAISALPPHSYPFSDSEILDYYREISAAVDIPMIVYEIPLRTHRALPQSLLLDLLDLQNTIGIKFTSNDLFKLSSIRASRPNKLYYFGFDEVFGAAASLGCEGGIGTTYNLFGKLYVELYQAVLASDLEKARHLQTISQEFVHSILKTGVIPGMKASFRAIGIDVGEARRPMASVSSEDEEKLKSFLTQPEIKKWLV